VIGAGIEVLGDAATDGLLVAPRHQRIDQPVAAAAREVVVVVAEPAEVVDVIRKLELEPRSPAGQLASSGRVGSEQHLLLGREERTRPHEIAGQLGVLRCRQVRVRSGRA